VCSASSKKERSIDGPDQRREDSGLSDPETGRRAQRFAEIVEQHQNELFAVSVRILGESGLAEDVLQDTFLKAYKALETLKPGSNTRAWLYRILVNTAYDLLDRQRTHARALTTLADETRTANRGYDENTTPDRKDLQDRVDEAVRALPEKYRDALLLRSIQGLSYAEVAEVLDIPETTARSLVHRGKRLLVPRLTPLMNEVD
jgi:RNA polymerase sigma-70 factor, ECF subfamily